MAVDSIPGVLDPVGVDAHDEAVYLALIDHPGVTAAELAGILGLTSREISKRLAVLESRGLVGRAATRPPRFRPAPPEVAGRVLVLRQQEALERTLLAFADLDARLRAVSQGTTAPAEAVEVLVGADTIMRWTEQLFRLVTREVMQFSKMPLATRDPHWDYEVEAERIRQGITWRCVYDPSVLTGQYLELTPEFVRAGEQARSAEVPTKLILVDRTLGLLPLRVGTAVESALLIHASPALDALIWLFEQIWRDATPLPGSRKVRGGLAPEDAQLLTLLAAGFKAEAVAFQLGLSRQAVQRRIAKLMRTMGAKTLFQLGQRAAQRGWLA
ncbi:MAG TPA: helix-turn-helix domain-containing protein [Candidatus Dormibacteraeota bacterium]|nr:helix-turn-helix domain-containing protein [Candidatus Dormibacteraeota bacterium]